VPPAGPGLELLTTLQRKAARLGFDWQDADGPLARVREELAALAAAPDTTTREAEMGALIEAVVGLARHLDVDPEAAARRASRDFRSRVEAVLAAAAAAGDDPRSLGPEGWTALWNRVESTGLE